MAETGNRASMKSNTYVAIPPAPARRGRWRWTRKTYRHAHSLSRLLSRYMYLPDHPPAIVRRYWDLWDRHRHGDDPLLVPLGVRLARFGGDDDIPF